ncbi:MAG: site-specific integrase [Myxococcales bacterium]|nr:site-specific integrase [Myxococcales bacterium]
MPVKAIAPRDVRQWVEELAKKTTVDRRRHRKVSRSTRRHCVNLLRACFGHAIADGIIETNPARDIKVRQEGDTADGWTFLTPQEQRAIATCKHIPEPDRLRILFAMYTGVRQSEQWCLLLADVKLDDSTGPHIIVRYAAPGRATKSNRVRRVPLIPEAVTVTRSWLELLPSYAPKNPLKLAFPTPRGHRRDRGKLYRFHELRTKAGITRPVRWHDLRHTCASSLAAGWWGRVWRLEEVRDLLGHSSVEVTERYAHLATSVIQTAANQTRRPAPAQLRSKRDPRGSKSSEPRRKARPSGAVGQWFESTGAHCSKEAERRKRRSSKLRAPGRKLRSSAPATSLAPCWSWTLSAAWRSPQRG